MTNINQRRLPLIPLSPLINTSSDHAKLLAETAKTLGDENTTPSARNSLQKNLIKEREKLDRLTKSMHVIQNSVLHHFTINEIAKEIAYIDCSLFRMVSLNEQWLCQFDKQSNIIPLVDFHRYLSHSFAHQVIMHCEAVKGIKKKPASSILGDLIQIAYILLNMYRDFSGCTAILTCLHMPEVQRLESAWSQCPSKMLTIYKDLVLMLSPHNDYEVYFQQLSLQIASFINKTPSKSQMIVVPFMHAHVSTLRTLINTHSSTSTTNVTVLSSAGQQLLSSFVHVLECCQQYAQIDPSEFAPVPKQRRASKRYSGIQASISACPDLDQIRSNPNIYHWVVSRVYLDRHQLHKESLLVEPLAVGEIELEPEEEQDLYWDFFTSTTTTTAAATSPPAKPLRSKRVQETPVDALRISEQPTEIEIPKKRNSSTQTVPILSPAAPEFIPTMKADDSDVVILDEDEEDDEEWTGYPLGSQASDDEEEWTGYPIQDEDEDEEEIWKGYPIPQEETSPSTPPQEDPAEEFPWKTSAIGKAAARRMQYSISNTDTTTHRKPLPSPFAPSTST